jgi:predicted amidohydrolase
MIRIAAIQPAAPVGADGHAAMVAAAWGLAADAADRGAELIVLPEYLNAMGLDREAARHRAAEPGGIIEQAREFCRDAAGWLLLPIIEQRGALIYNAAHLFSPSGDTILRYDKTHLTITERRDLGLTPGDAVPVVDTPLGRIGVMTCYDIYFPEVARLLSLQGADLIIFPSLQRSDTPERCMLMGRVRAIDSTCHLVRASYGLPSGEQYAPGKVYGGSCVIAPDGAVLAEAGLYEGVAIAEVDLHAPWVRNRCSGAPPEPVRDFIRQDRRPELYGQIVEET